MRILIILLASCSFTSLAVADDSEKLDAILKELRDLKSRVQVLEQKLDAIGVAKRPTTQKSASVRIIDIDDSRGIAEPYLNRVQPSRLAPSKEVEEVMRMQFESPGQLLKGIHDRERRLRHRFFSPDSIPHPWPVR